MLEKEGFVGYLEDIINNIDDSVTKGIAKYAIENGIDSLSSKQKYTLENGLSDYIMEKCPDCDEDISFEDMPIAMFNGRCSGCNHTWERIQSE
jgi:hypothetical protein